MKKSASLLAAMATLAMAGAAQALPVKADKSAGVQQTSKQTHRRKHHSTAREIRFNGFGGLEHTPFDAGTPPKVYGQYLQRSGKQKWTKKKR